MNSPTYTPCPGTVWFWLLYELPSKLSSLSSPIFFWCFSWPLSAFTFPTRATSLSHWPLPQHSLPWALSCCSLYLILYLTDLFSPTHTSPLSQFICVLYWYSYIRTWTYSPANPSPYHSQWNSPTISQYPVKNWESGREQLKTLLALREEKWDEKRKLELDHVSMRGVTSPALYRVPIFRLETPHASFSWRQVLESPLGSVLLKSMKQRRNENPSPHAKREQ